MKDFAGRKYQIDVDTATREQLKNIEEINVSDITMNSKVTTWDFSMLTNLKKINIVQSLYSICRFDSIG